MKTASLAHPGSVLAPIVGLTLTSTALSEGKTGTAHITVDVTTVLSSIPENPVGFCGNFLDDTDQRETPRSRTMADVLKAAGSGTYRWPAGTIAENYLWHTPGGHGSATDGLRPRAISIPKFSWKPRLNADGTFRSSMDFDEFVATCKQSGAEPIVLVSSYGWKLPEAVVSRDELITSAREWVRYANVTRGYGVRYWEIGNEVDLAKVPISREEYLDYYGEVVDAMKSVDPDIQVGLGLLRGSAHRYYREAFARFPDKIDFVVAHQYHTGLKDYEDYAANAETYIKSIEDALKNIDRFAPESRRDQIGLLVTECSAFSPQRRWENTEPTFYKAMLTFEMMANAIASDSRVRSMNFWITHNPWGPRKITDANALDNENRFTAMGQAVALLGSHLQTQMVAAPRVAGDIRSYASYDPAEGGLSVFLVNKASGAREVRLDIAGLRDAKTGRILVFQGDPDPDSTKYQLEDGTPIEFTGKPISLSLRPTSITLLRF